SAAGDTRAGFHRRPGCAVIGGTGLGEELFRSSRIPVQEPQQPARTPDVRALRRSFAQRAILSGTSALQRAGFVFQVLSFISGNAGPSRHRRLAPPYVRWRTEQSPAQVDHGWLEVRDTTGNALLEDHGMNPDQTVLLLDL